MILINIYFITYSDTKHNIQILKQILLRYSPKFTLIPKTYLESTIETIRAITPITIFTQAYHVGAFEKVHDGISAAIPISIKSTPIMPSVIFDTLPPSDRLFFD
ncbi:hypothetical protein COT77_00440 [Candidatus Berkelbacteria bacterium CG10_big_fil_rev_8_21_14_0_10_41_12]|uniref:Uncharacterized protein n=1 Tax=Candidatus Berkelbacteria bacterium CG10_big_fil_rev_8_21_14_0_10_41_12 TaxID=1974513 RepID=A0A2M6WXY3_9BACT|nr:MAG: hypothetical protein COT77_00440 [Candidatus Berkelbacteria bacterium CG10_big_fil_rev_8_21_14_0_10_41_12]